MYNGICANLLQKNNVFAVPNGCVISYFDYKFSAFFVSLALLKIKK